MDALSDPESGLTINPGQIKVEVLGCNFALGSISKALLCVERSSDRLTDKVQRQRTVVVLINVSDTLEDDGVFHFTLAQLSPEDEAKLSGIYVSRNALKPIHRRLPTLGK